MEHRQSMLGGSAHLSNTLQVCIGCFSFPSPLIEPHQFHHILNYSSFFDVSGAFLVIWDKGERMPFIYFPFLIY